MDANRLSPPARTLCCRIFPLRWLLYLGLATWLTACAGGAHLPAVADPEPWLEPVGSDLAAPAAGTGTIARLPKAWLLYSQPPEVYGVPVWQAPAGTELAVTGRWHAPPGLSGFQPWALMSEIWDWYRLTAHLPAWGQVHVWGQLPPDWVQAGDDIPWVEPPWGEPWETVPYADGLILVPPAATPLALHVCPRTVCPILERPARGQAVPVTGRHQDAEGQLWWRVEFRQTILWAEAGTGVLRRSRAGFRRRGGRNAAGVRSCEPVVMFPPPPHTLCPVNAAGRFVDEFERQYDGLDPIFGRLPLPAPEATGVVVPATPEALVPAVPTASPTPITITVTGATVNLRTGPGLDYPVQTQARQGTQLIARGLNPAGDWIQTADPQGGPDPLWIHAPLTSLTDPHHAGLPVVASPAPSSPAPATLAPPPTVLPASAPPTPEPPAVSTPTPRAAPQRHYLDSRQRQFVLLGDWTAPADPDLVCEEAFIVTVGTATLRAGPGREHRVLTTVPQYTPLPVQETQGSWHRVGMAGIGVVPDHWIHEDQGQRGGWCVHVAWP